MKKITDIILYVLISLLPIINIHASWDGHSPFLVHIIPKCGTHFTLKTLRLLTETEIRSVGVESSKISAKMAEEIIPRISGPYKTDVDFFLTHNQIKMVAVIRDPRDAIISHLFYMRSFYQNDPNVGLRRDFFTVSADFDSLSFDDQLTTLITGKPGMMSYVDFYISRIHWSLRPGSLRIKYEDLVGVEGGGSKDKQMNAIRNIANYINYPLTDSKLDFVISNMYQKSSNVQEGNKTFVRASQGNWKTFFKPVHKKLFKKKIQNYLLTLQYELDNNW